LGKDKVKKVKKEKVDKKGKKQKKYHDMMSQKKVKRGIRFKLMLIFILLIGVPLIVQGIFSYTATVNVLESNLSEMSVQFSSTASDLIQNYLVGYEESVMQFADNKSVQTQHIFPNALLSTMDAFDAYLNSHKDVMYVYVGSKNKKMFMRPDEELPDDYDPTIRPWYLDAVAADDIIWTEPYEDASSGALIISAAKPVYNGKNLAGVIALDLRLSDLAVKLGDVQIGESGYLIVLSNENKVLVHENPELIGKELSELKIGELEKSLKTNDADSVEYTFEGKKYVSSYVTSPLGWKIISTLPKSEINSDSMGVLKILIILAIVVMGIALAISALFANSLTVNIKKLLTGIAKVEQGDLTTRFGIKSHDEIGLLSHYFEETLDIMGGMMKGIQSVVVEVTESAQNLAATSEEASATADEIARTVEDIARGASDQARDTEGGAKVAHSLSEKFEVLNENTTMMIASAESVMTANTEGIDAVEGLRTKSEQSNEANSKIADVIGELNEKTQHIGTILDSISAIAVQTNLLALNASIEAARAGEHGRGFAVVAEEIRKLAEQSSESAEQIKEIITNIQSDSEKTVESMEDVKTISEEQAEAVIHVNDSFKTISKAIEDIAGKIDQISGSVTELNLDKDSLVEVIGNISAVSEETAAASEEVSASTDQQSYAVDEVAKAAERLNEISLNLEQEAKRFKV